jgi:ABC-2 type transport system permease protein
MMNSFWAVFKRELKGYFATPVAYVFLVIFLVAAGYFPFQNNFFEIRQADLRLFFNNLPLFFVFMVSAVSMRLWAEERKNGSIELLLTLPITVMQAVLGKFFAAWAFLGIALLLTIPMPLTVLYLGNPDIGQIVVGYLGSFLMAGSFLAIGMFFSAVTKNQVISLILSVVACLMLLFAGHPSTLSYITSILSPAVVGVFEMLSFQTHYDSIMRGVVELKDIAYFVILMITWIFACMMILEERKAS